MIARRRFLSFLAAPAIVRASSIMAVAPVIFYGGPLGGGMTQLDVRICLYWFKTRPQPLPWFFAKSLSVA